MYIPKTDIVTILKQLNAEVYQIRPEVLEVFPCVTYYIADNRPELVLEKEIGYQEIKVVIDIYANTSVEAGDLLTDLEEKMRAEDYRLDYSADVPDPDGYAHITTRFNLIV